MSAAKNNAEAKSNGLRINKHPDVRKMGYLRKLKTMKKKYFVLREEKGSEPARLEYYDTEKKWRTGATAKRTIVLKTCFNINRKLDTKHKNAIALYTKDDCFAIVLDNEEELEDWLTCLLELQQGEEALTADEVPKPTFEHIWQVNVRNRGLASTKNILGPYHLCLTSKVLSLVKLNSDVPDVIEFPLMSIRRCGHSYCFFFMELGRSAVTGSGELWMQTEDVIIAQNMHEAILNAMRSSAKDDMAPRPRTRSSSANESSKPIAVHIRRQTTVAAPGIPTPSNRERSDSFPNRPRTISDSPRDLCGSKPPQPTTLDIQRPHSMYNRAISYSPPVGSVLPSPGSGQYTTDSCGSSLSIDDHDSFQFDFFASHYSHPLMPDNGHQTEPSITEEGQDYLPMTPPDGKMSAPSKLDESNSDGYMDMASPTNAPQSFLASFSSRSHTPSQQTAVMPNRCSAMAIKSQMNKSPPEQGAYLEMTATSPLEQVGYMPMSPLGSSFTDVPLKPPTPVRSYLAKSPPASISFRTRKTSLDEPHSEGYISMAPLVSSRKRQEGYMEMTSSVTGTPASGGTYLEMGPVTSPSSSGTLSGDLHFSEFQLEKVRAYFTPAEDEEKIVRAYSVGSKPFTLCDKKKEKSNSATESSRARALSVGSKVGLHFDKRAASELDSIQDSESNSRNKKSASAPLLGVARSAPGAAASLSRTPTTNKNKNEDLMEFDFARVGDSSNRKSDGNVAGAGDVLPRSNSTIGVRTCTNNRSSVRPTKLDALEVIGERADMKSTLYGGGDPMKKSPTIGSYAEVIGDGTNTSSKTFRVRENSFDGGLKSHASIPLRPVNGTDMIEMDRAKEEFAKPDVVSHDSVLHHLNAQADMSSVKPQDSPTSGGEYVNIDLNRHYRRKGVFASTLPTQIVKPAKPFPSTVGLSAKPPASGELTTKLPATTAASAKHEYMNLHVGNWPVATAKPPTHLPSGFEVMQGSSDAHVPSAASALTKPTSRTLQSIAKMQKQLSAPVISSAATAAALESVRESGPRKISMPTSIPLSASKPVVSEALQACHSGPLLASPNTAKSDKSKSCSPQLTPSGGSQSSLSSTGGVEDQQLLEHSHISKGSPVFVGVTFGQHAVPRSRRSMSEAPYENISFSNSKSRPASVSSERELNYASLDLMPASTTEEEERAAPSSLSLKNQGMSGAASFISEDVERIRLSYAKIDFTKSEGLRTTSNNWNDYQ